MKIESDILRRLGPVPFWRGEQRCLTALDALYRKARDRAQSALARTRPAARPPSTPRRTTRT